MTFQFVLPTVIHMGRSEKEIQLDVLLEIILVPVTNGVRINPKLLRDILDVTEGYLINALNSKGNYDHSTLKAMTKHVSKSALELKKSLNKSELLKKTHREHAEPLKIVIEGLYSSNFINKVDLKKFLNKNLISVLITKAKVD